MLYQLWAFIVPGLTAKEKKWSIPFIVSASRAVRLMGAVFAYVTLPKALDFLLGFAGEVVVPLDHVRSLRGVRRRWSPWRSACRSCSRWSWCSWRPSASCRRRLLSSWRRWAILGIAIFAAVITPSGDPYTMFAMMIPMYLFYEGSIIIGRMMKR